MQYAVYLLARRRYSYKQMEEKLTNKCKKVNKKTTPENIDLTDDQKEAIEEVFKFLLFKNYINDTEYTDLYIKSELQRKPSGKYSLSQKLLKKRIDKNIIKSALESYSQENEYEFARDALQRKLKTFHEKDTQKRKEKLSRFLASRGFPFQIIQRVMKEALDLELEQEAE